MKKSKTFIYTGGTHLELEVLDSVVVIELINDRYGDKGIVLDKKQAKILRDSLNMFLGEDKLQEENKRLTDEMEKVHERWKRLTLENGNVCIYCDGDGWDKFLERTCSYCNGHGKYIE